MIELHESLTPAAREALGLNAAQAYGSLVPAGPYTAAKPLLERLSRDGAIVEACEREMDRAAVAALWLWHDCLDESHTISQGLETPEGSYWHAIMHRREGDFWNSKYWLRRVGAHPVLARIAIDARDLIASRSAPELQRLAGQTWDASTFVDFCESIHEKPRDPGYALAVELQRIEWRALFAHCVQMAQR